MDMITFELLRGRCFMKAKLSPQKSTEAIILEKKTRNLEKIF